jgi:ribosomal protein S12 methylthiotransferase accessory factor
MSPLNAELPRIIDHIRSLDVFDDSVSGVEHGRIEALRQQIAVTRVGCVTQLDRIGIPVYYAVRPDCACPSAAYSSGKAFTDRNAALGALFESYERWAAERPAVSISASLRSLAGHEALKECLIFQPDDIPETSCIRWAAGLHLATRQIVLMPSCFVEFPPGPPGAGVFTTTGLAAHPVPVHATANGLLECVERHFAATFTLQSLLRVEMASFSQQAIGLAETLAREHIELHVFAIAQTPAFSVAYAYAYDHWLEWPQLQCSGFAAGFNLADAIDKAVLEVAQSRAAFMTGLRDDVAASVAPKSFDDRMVNRQREWRDALRAIDRTAPGGQAARQDIAGGLRRLLGSPALNNPLIFPLQQAQSFPAVRVVVPEFVDCVWD